MLDCANQVRSINDLTPKLQSWSRGDDTCFVKIIQCIASTPSYRLVGTINDNPEQLELPLRRCRFRMISLVSCAAWSKHILSVSMGKQKRDLDGSLHNRVWSRVPRALVVPGRFTYTATLENQQSTTTTTVGSNIATLRDSLWPSQWAKTLLPKGQRPRAPSSSCRCLHE